MTSETGAKEISYMHVEKTLEIHSYAMFSEFHGYAKTFYPRTLVEKVEILFIVQKETSQYKICFRNISF